MAEWKLFQGDIPHVSTFEFHEHRERAPHLEQPHHRPRLEKAAEFVRLAAAELDEPTVSDLGCGDGGLLSLVHDEMAAWGYDFAPANVAGWAERGVVASPLDVFGGDRDRVILGHITVVTEVLEHLADPHGAVKWIGGYSPYIVASSPWTERPGAHDECHAWAWDRAGYEALIEAGGYEIRRHDLVGPFQVILGAKP
jgi:hypothetical protein